MRDFRNVIFLLIVAVFLLQMFVLKQDAKLAEEKNQAKPTVALSTFSLYDIAKNISNDTIDLVMILPFGVDAHSFEPTPKLMAKIMQSDIVIYSGAGLEPWTSSFEFKNRVIDMSKHVKLLNSEHGSCNHEEHQHHGGHEEEMDPHYWLDIQNMIDATNLIAGEFSKLSKENEELYRKNAEIYISELQAIDEEYKQRLASCKKETIIVNHNAFSYLSQNYGFEVEALSGLSPDAQSNAQNMLKLIEHVKEHDLKVVFFESFVSDKAMKSIANEANVAVDVLQPLGNITADEAKKDLSYKDIMLENLEKISNALECK
ncbi:hypothetical protein M947_02745 [Sulfurimonas hongkongensis]|uniref:ABC transporter substrate-binding protein n=1 Tax=Sulfurimonas hongkongensis TaxID=1172190 RepID=T0JTJ2_9BACT|nr:metal ABC transporter substrate-binding protein [Sulfurimonas hongkongensis]EQB40272.1 hypothetical protein M947_02745 [Sulfurimonas hongkongensis]